MRVAVDAMGGDNAPEPIVHGAVQAVVEHGVEAILVGDETQVRACLPRLSGDVTDKLTYQHTDDFIKMDESGLLALRRADCSVCRAALLVKEGKADAAISMGNTGAAMVAGTSYLECIEGINRPAIGLVLPTAVGKPFLLIDAGATADCRSLNLLQFAHMGHTYAQDVMHIPSPRIGLLSNGEEQVKGSRLYKASHKLLSRSGLNFVGNVEPHILLECGVADVAVCDGFVGNVVLKALEGCVHLMKGTIRHAFTNSLWGKIVGLAARPILREALSSQDPDQFGGAVLLGVRGVLVVGHGRSNAQAVSNAIRVAKEAHEKRVVEHIREAAAALASVSSESGESE
jgi:glycerol-3-phosphate acyltransferase PlsX